jgi:hypothetical protein
MPIHAFFGAGERQVGAQQFTEVLEEVSGSAAVAEWLELQETMRPLAKAATALPPAALRSDLGVAVSAVFR